MSGDGWRLEARMKTRELIELDKRHVWHPFTPNDLWLDPAFEPIVIAEGDGCTLMDTEGRHYLDGNASIWTNLHGHRNPRIHQAIKDQLDRIAHSSFLGISNDRAPLLAAELCQATGLDRCFFSDDGSTAMETALKMVVQFFQQNGQPHRTRIISLGSGYHGDTVGAMSMGHSTGFHRPFESLLFPSTEVMSPGCYHCPYNRARPEKADARTYRQCSWECLDAVEKTFQSAGDTAAAFVLEPRVQGAAGFVMHPHGYLEKAAAVAQQSGALVVLDEVMTGFGRTGPDFAYQHEEVRPDVIALAKGLTGGTLPLAATLCRESLFSGFSNGLEKTFFHGHSYSGNALGCAAAMASWQELKTPESGSNRQYLNQTLAELSSLFWEHPHVGDVRQEGTILAIELVQDAATRTRFDPALRTGARVCQQAAQIGLLTRPVGDVLVLMPPYCTTSLEAERMVEALLQALKKIF
ncbi:MAG: adenosylmethionine--8-amino-7-oxononanoate transaminase [Candidatus Methylacidiphilales bacterium]